MTNNPRKIAAMGDMGIDVVARVPIQSGHNRHNQRYLETKESRLGHLFND